MRFGYFPHLFLGICYENQGLWEEAEEEYKISFGQTRTQEAQDRLKVATVEADKVRRQKKLLKSWTDLYLFALEAMKNKKWEDAVKFLRDSLKYRQGNDPSFEHLGQKVPYTPHLLIFKCYKSLNFKEEELVKELVQSFEKEQSDETETLLASYLPGIWVHP
jgi:tetratricopeptide (TPR) repeat protein